MRKRIRDPGWNEPMRYGSRHGPSARGDPAIRGKPPFVECANTKMREYINVPTGGKPPLIWCRCVLIRGKPAGSLHRKCRVYAVKNSVGFFGVFIPNREWYAEEAGSWKHEVGS